MLSQKIGRLDRNNLKCHGHKQTQWRTLFYFVQRLMPSLCLDKSPATTLLSTRVTFQKWWSSDWRSSLHYCRSLTLVTFVFMFIWYEHVAFSITLSLFLVAASLQHNSSPTPAVLPALRGVTHCGHLHPLTPRHDTSPSCNSDFSRQFYRACEALVLQHPCKIPTQSNTQSKS